MLEKLAEVEKRYNELEESLGDPKLLENQKEYSKVAKERADLVEVVSCYRDWRKVEAEIDGNRQLLEDDDEEMQDLAREELTRLRSKKEELEVKLKILLLPTDPNDKHSGALCTNARQMWRSLLTSSHLGFARAIRVVSTDQTHALDCHL